jgi:hypothetical protein
MRWITLKPRASFFAAASGVRADRRFRGSALYFYDDGPVFITQRRFTPRPIPFFYPHIFTFCALLHEESMKHYSQWA